MRTSESSSQKFNRFAKKSLGQNFLIDQRVLSSIIRAAEISKDDLVVEIGTGRGFLTRELLNQGARVVGVEMDENLASQLSEEMRHESKLEIITGDARHLSLDQIFHEENPKYKVVANLPYYAAMPIIMRFLEADKKPTNMIIMIQREVAQNMVAKPGKMSTLSVMSQLYGSPKIIRYVSPGCFRPMPTVTSAIVHIDVYNSPYFEIRNDRDFARLVRAGFSSSRKQIHNSLRNGINLNTDQVNSLLNSAQIDKKRRAETLTMDEWGLLYESYEKLL